jgi:hypothetical protein
MSALMHSCTLAATTSKHMNPAPFSLVYWTLQRTFVSGLKLLRCGTCPRASGSFSGVRLPQAGHADQVQTSQDGLPCQAA